MSEVGSKTSGRNCQVEREAHDLSSGLSICWGCHKSICGAHVTWVSRHGLPSLSYCPACHQKIEAGQMQVAMPKRW